VVLILDTVHIEGRTILSGIAEYRRLHGSIFSLDRTDRLRIMR
jgi:hypothetical protein